MDFNYSDTIMHLMSHVIKLYRQNVDSLIQEYDVYPGQPPLLLRLGETDGQIQRGLAESLNLAPATLTVMIHRMQKTGLVERKADEKDQRVSRVFLTDKGRLALHAVKEALQTLESKCFEHFSAEEKVLFQKYLQQVHSDMKIFKGNC